MRVIIIGMGIQGKKRKKFLGREFVYSVDKFKPADFKYIYKVPLDKFDSAIICVTDNEKLKIVNYCIQNKKNVLVEKPMLTKNSKVLKNLIKLAKNKKVIFYTAYNHRFEPNIIKMKQIIKSKKLGKIYKCRIFYGNGTSALVKKSKWRDKGMGVLTDIGSHLIDICLYWFGQNIKSLKTVDLNKFENKALDNASIKLEINRIKIDLEMSLCMWKNTFACDLIASKGSVHLNSFCKWSNSSFIYRKRKIPSGLPNEKYTSFKKGDPTWKKEYLYFKSLVNKKSQKFLNNDLIINNCFKKLKRSSDQNA